MNVNDGVTEESSLLGGGSEKVARYDDHGGNNRRSKGKTLKMAAGKVISEKRMNTGPSVQSAASVLLSRLMSSKKKNKEKEREWQETHVDVFHSSTRMSTVGESEFRRRMNAGGGGGPGDSFLSTDSEVADEEVRIG